MTRIEQARQAYQVIKDAGTNGISKSDLCYKVGAKQSGMDQFLRIVETHCGLLSENMGRVYVFGIFEEEL
jgi:hypothetical protein